MKADAFHVLYEQLVVEPGLAVGFERWGKRLWRHRDGMQIAVLCTETRNDWPFELALVARHDCLRDFKDRCPPPRSGNEYEYPVKAAPSAAVRLVRRYRYEPHNFSGVPAMSWTSGGSPSSSRRSATPSPGPSRRCRSA